MATNDVPGFNPANADVLKAMAWAEHEDGSLILVESTEAGRVVFSVFDLSQEPILEYRHAMPEDEFKRKFSWKSGDQMTNDKWTWHDKTPFDWDRVIKAGAKPGLKFTSAGDQITAAQRVADALRLKAQAVNAAGLDDKATKRVMKLANKLEKALASLPA
jgi:hypothetical protein